MDFCLGIELLGYCNDYYNYELSVFNIGVFLGIVGVVFAGYQLTDKIHQIRFKMRISFLWKVIFSIPFITIIFATILPFIPGDPLPLLGYPIFWEVLTALYCIVLGIIVVLFLFLRRINIFDNKFGELNKIYVSLIAHNKYVDVLVSETGYFFKNFYKQYIEDENNKKWGYAHQFLVVIQNDRFIESVIHNPWVLDVIFSIYITDNREVFSAEENEFLSKILIASLRNNDSYLAYEMRGNFNLDYKNFNGIVLTKILSNLDFIGKINLLYEYNHFSFLDDLTYVNNLLSFLGKIYTLFVKPTTIENNYKKHNILLQCFELNARIIERSFDKLDIVEKSKCIPFGWIAYSTNNIDNFLKKLYIGNKYPDIFLNKDGIYDKENSNTSYLDAFAFGYIEILNALSRFDLELIEYHSKSLIFYDSDELSNEINKRMMLLYKSQITENLKGYYPMLSKMFWNNYSYIIVYETETANMNSGLVDIILLYAQRLKKLSQGYVRNYTEQMLNKEYTKNKAQELANEIMGDLFTKNMLYNYKNEIDIFFDDGAFILDLNETLREGKIIVKDGTQ